MIDVLGISDQDCWDYGVELEAIIKEEKLENVRFRPCMSVLGFICDDGLTEKVFLDTAQMCREKLETRFAPTEQHLTELIKSDKDTTLTYCGMVKFLQSEMETSATLIGLGSSAKIRLYKKTAKMMMRRSEAFTGAIRALFPHHVRLSMHPSSGVSKLSVALIPAADGGFQKSPWHSCIAIGLNGQPACVHSEDVRDTHDLILRNGRPYFFQERFKESFSEWRAFREFDSDMKDVVTYTSMYTAFTVANH
jgi:pyoverdine/dityrosine biosynthesis protein Dit1